MGLTIRKQFPEFEIDEYTEEVSVTLDEAIAEIRQFDWINESLKSSKIVEEHAEPCIRLRNQADDILSLFWAEDNKFAVYSLVNTVLKRSSTSVVKGYEEVYELVRLFEQNERQLLASRLLAAEQHFKTLWLIDLMNYFVKTKNRNSRETVREESVYQITWLRALKINIFSLLLLLFPSVLCFNPFQSRSRPFDWVFFLSFQAVCTMLVVPALILLVNHLKKNKGWEIHFRKGDNTFIIVFPGGKEMFNKSDFEKRIVTTNGSNAPWSEFEYSTLVRKDGKQLHISNLLVPTQDMDKLFGRMETSHEKSRFQLIKVKRIAA
jgi:hypothetical protein